MRGQKGIDEADEKEVVAPLRLLELFSGTGFIGRAFEAQGWEVISVIWASPPCTNYSALRKSIEDERLDSDELVRRTLEIAKTL